MKLIKIILASSIALSLASNAFANDIKTEFKKDYAKLVYANYSDALQDAKELQKVIEVFLDDPNDKTLKSAKNTWLNSRDSYGQTEAFRFYEGPIDFVDQKRGIEGPEGRLNAWPLDEAYIDYVQGDENAGIVNDKKYEISKKSLAKSNQENDESQVSLGYHAVEFLLWGQDFSTTGPGNRSYKDFAKEEKNESRRKYLNLVTNMLVNDLEFLVDEWKENKWTIFSKNYESKFVQLDNDVVLKNVLSALATLSAFELASERMATALDSGDQEDEHSCFSDNTHNDFIYNQQGIKNVYLGDYKDFKGVGIYEVLAEKNQKLADKILNKINQTQKLISDIPSPIDAKVLATRKGSFGRIKMEKAVTSLQEQAKLFLEAGKELGLKVQIISE